MPRRRAGYSNAVAGPGTTHRDGKVDGVRTDLSGTQNDLKMARSELGTLIARNHEDVEQLRRLGERDYIEFTIDSKNKPQKVGSFVVELRGTNVTKKRYSVSLGRR
jgi:hypothetical protein